ncbi:hypothetical protein P3X46_000032 [Hevea brasiliensis]|uniref:Glycine-rich protein n=1 Tax=Hevea brasiliensis TaxID=3981 RepID=A0ABQ9N805_HEVBR|nr:uncharacterized protein LOC110669194 [Hevea brasiliensis]KAJ9188657.1 hypothetical protein P3X46_000032 [Hevea brasiliensis]
MGFKKLGLFFLVIILFQVHLHAHPLQNNTSTATTAFHQEPNATDQKISRAKKMIGKFEVAEGQERLVSVDRRGGGGGGGHGSHSMGSRAHGGEVNGNGDTGYRHGATVVPLYAAGAMNHHQNNHRNRGSNEGCPNHAGSSYLVLAALAACLLKYFA